MQHKLILNITLLAALLITPLFQAQAATNTIGRIMFTYGPAWIQQGSSLTKIKKGDTVSAHYSIVTGPRARVKIQMRDGSNIYIGSKSKVALQQYAMAGKSLVRGTINMLWGKARFFVNKLTNSGASFRVRTPTAVLGVRGTWFIVSVPPTPEVLSRAFDNIQLTDMPPLPTRTVLMEGAIDVGIGSGTPTRLTPGQTADIDNRRGISVRKSEASDIDNHRDTTPPKAKTQKPKSSPKDSGGTRSDNGEGKPKDKGDGKSKDNKSGPQNNDGAPEDNGDTPNNPKPSDADKIMNENNQDAEVTGSENTAVNKSTPPPLVPTAPPQPNRATAPVPADQQGAISNAVQNIGATDIILKPSFVAP